MERVISRLEEWIVVIVLSIMSTIAFVNIVSRGLLGHSFSFAEEVTVNLFVALTFVGTAIGVRQYAHLGFTLIYDVANLVVKNIITILVGILMSLLFVILIYFGIQMLLFQVEMGQKTPALGWPQWVFSMAMPIGATLCLFRTIQATIKEYRDQNGKGEQSV